MKIIYNHYKKKAPINHVKTTSQVKISHRNTQFSDVTKHIAGTQVATYLQCEKRYTTLQRENHIETLPRENDIATYQNYPNLNSSSSSIKPHIYSHHSQIFSLDCLLQFLAPAMFLARS